MTHKLVNLIVEIFEYIWNILLAIRRDILGIILVVKTDRYLSSTMKVNQNVNTVFRANVRKHPNKACIVYYDTVWTFKDMDEYSDRIGNMFKKVYNLKKGDCVAIFVENKPEFVGIWLGLSKIGVISAWINTNLKSQSLVHSIKVANAKALVYSKDLDESVETAINELDKNLIYLSEGGDSKIKGSLNLETMLKRSSDEPVYCDDEIASEDVLCYIYTSGTTGLPKPAIVKHYRYYGAAKMFADIGKLDQDDIMYVSLPIYHSNGGMLGIGSAIARGLTCVLRKKFSASSFWKDCIDNKCTTFVYVGEICRFLVNQPPSDLDRKHTIRTAFGNGLRINIWKNFLNRFNIQCYEFYGASEGNCTSANITAKTGACGFVPLFHKIIKQPPIFIIKIDEEMNPIRDKKTGFCIECERGEPGLIVGLIGDKPRTAYNGYANNKEASEKKIIENVFKKGQRAFNSGDLMMCDSFGYLYFCDRLGDTYRWRGENVSTIEVENIISSHLNSREVVVYGVQVGNQEGRAGMAAILDSNDIDLDKLTKAIVNDLASYARPLFLRFVKEIDHTGTFKIKKARLVSENFDLNQVKDKLFYFESKSQKYMPLTLEIQKKINDGSFRL